MSNAAGSILLGAGGHARVVAEVLKLLGRNVFGHVSPGRSDDPRMGQYLGPDEAIPELLAQEYRFVCGIGGTTRAGLVMRHEVCLQVPLERFEVVAHPSAQIAASANLERGVFVGALGIVGPDVQIGAHALVNSGAVVEHDCEVGANTHCATGARIAGGVKIGESSLVGAGSTILQGLEIGKSTVIGAGSVVLHDVPDLATVVGNPARIVKVQKS